MNRTNRRRALRGFTLIEVGIAVTLAGIVLSGALALFLGLTGMDRQARSGLAGATARSQLTERFRADVAAATACRLFDEQQPEAGIVLAGAGDHSIRYLGVEGGVQRLAFAGDKLEHREFYRLSDNGRAKFKLSIGSPPEVTCTIESNISTGRAGQEALPGNEVRRTLTIAAVLARDQRLVEAVQRAASEKPVVSNPTPPTEAAP